MTPTRLLAYGEAFIGCPTDAESFADRLVAVWDRLPVPGVRPRLMRWREHADLHAASAAQGSQYHIARTSDPATNPVFILIAQGIGTPLRPPTDTAGERRWRDLRGWLDAKGWGVIAMVGDDDFRDPTQPPDDKVPLTGTLYELFDAMRTDPDHPDPGCRGPNTHLKFFDLSRLPAPADKAAPGDEAALRDAMAEEAQRIVESAPNPVPPAGVSHSLDFATASVLPQVKVALQRVITQWLDDHPLDRPDTHADRILDLPRHGALAGIAGAIDALGETAWTAWREVVVRSEKLDPRGIYERQRLQDTQDRGFGALMAGLVDRTGKDVDIAWLAADDPRARRQPALVEALRDHRLLTRVDGRHLRLPHRILFQEWHRARRWLDDVAERLATKPRLRGRWLSGDDAMAWPETDLDAFARLVVDWIGPRQGEDGEIWDYATNGLVARFDPVRLDIDADSPLDRLPFVAIAVGLGDQPFVAGLIDKVMAAPAAARAVGMLAILLSDRGYAEPLQRILTLQESTLWFLRCGNRRPSWQRSRWYSGELEERRPTTGFAYGRNQGNARRPPPVLRPAAANAVAPGGRAAASRRGHPSAQSIPRGVLETHGERPRDPRDPMSSFPGSKARS